MNERDKRFMEAFEALIRAHAKVLDIFLEYYEDEGLPPIVMMFLSRTVKTSSATLAHYSAVWETRCASDKDEAIEWGNKMEELIGELDQSRRADHEIRKAGGVPPTS